jgi:hypothetical protein
MPAVITIVRADPPAKRAGRFVYGLDTDLLVGATLVSRLIIGGGSLDGFTRSTASPRERDGLSPPRDWMFVRAFAIWQAPRASFIRSNR